MHSKMYTTCRLNGCVPQGVNAGVTIPVSIPQVGSMTASTTVSVVATYVCLTKISLVAYTGATWLSPPASISPIASVTAQLQPLQVHSAGHFETAASVMAAMHRIQFCCMSVK
jgi:hypothetical protein